LRKGDREAFDELVDICRSFVFEKQEPTNASDPIIYHLWLALCVMHGKIPSKGN
jgi:hypothetical protein